MSCWKFLIWLYVFLELFLELVYSNPLNNIYNIFEIVILKYDGTPVVWGGSFPLSNQPSRLATQETYPMFVHSKQVVYPQSKGLMVLLKFGLVRCHGNFGFDTFHRSIVSLHNFYRYEYFIGMKFIQQTIWFVERIIVINFWVTSSTSAIRADSSENYWNTKWKWHHILRMDKMFFIFF